MRVLPTAMATFLAMTAVAVPALAAPVCSISPDGNVTCSADYATDVEAGGSVMSEDPKHGVVTEAGPSAEVVLDYGAAQPMPMPGARSDGVVPQQWLFSGARAQPRIGQEQVVPGIRLGSQGSGELRTLQLAPAKDIPAGTNF